MNTASLSFAALGVRAPLGRALDGAGITEPFPIQADTLPDALAGRDVLGRGRTGSGKTLAFAIPMIDRLGGELAARTVPNRPAGLVLAPTRELATQIAAAMEPLAAAYRMTVTTVFGGVSQHRQVQALRRGADIVVACPGRLEDLIGQGLIALDAVEITVIDEADHMADLGFLPGVTRILAATPADGQRLLFSATLDNGVNRLVQRFLPRAVRHSVDEATSPVPAMTHHVFEVPDPAAKRALVHRLASGTGRRILFTRTKHQARKLSRQLTADGIPAVDLHGNLTQNARDRNLATFASGTATVLVATDVAARGVHVDGVELVVHVDPPAEHKAYLHRSGRTARAGSAGDVVTLILPAERRDTAALLRKADIDVTPQRVPTDSPVVSRLVGTPAPPRQAPNQPAPEGNGKRRGNRPQHGTPQGRSRGTRSGGSARANSGAPQANEGSTRTKRGPARTGRGPAQTGGATAHAGGNSARAERGSAHAGHASARAQGRTARPDGGSARTNGGTARAGNDSARTSRGSAHAGGDSARTNGRSAHTDTNSARAQGNTAHAGSSSARTNRGPARNGSAAGSGSRTRSGGSASREKATGRGAAPAGSSGGLVGFSRTGGGRGRRR